VGAVVSLIDRSTLFCNTEKTRRGKKHMMENWQTDLYPIICFHEAYKMIHLMMAKDCYEDNI
jgi:hypothetical protein